ncbi:BCCT family transporter [Apibacter raozihei]|uniref:BCCT family transporter n=1 Tax=Apibacter raozihei TaxID=2500547 RepID=UPI000FE3CCFD|nr:BCCT family transporter [Apibacter raozihei]
MSKSIKQKLSFTTSFSKSVALPGLLVIVFVSIFCGFFPEKANTILLIIQGYIFEKLSWVYVLLITFFILFLIILALSKLGNIRLGSDNSKPKYSFFSWIAMLFAAGMGIGLMYFGVAETMSHYSNPPIPGGDAIERAKNAQLYTFFHWGIHAWAIYATLGLILAYFSYRYKLPLAIRSALYPLLKDKINGTFGNIIDTFALCSTFFGIATTLGFGIVQLCAGLTSTGLIENPGFIFQIIIVVVVMSIAIGSTLSGLDKGVKKLSELNLLLALLFMLFILFTGPTIYILGTFSEGVGYYISNFTSLTFNTFAFETDGQQWFSQWTILYWAWWISWAPFVGLFIAKISKGRTIREFIIAVLIIPSIFNFLWMSIFGSSAIWIDKFEADGALGAMVNNPDILLFKFFEYFPLTKILNILAIGIITVFFVTSADSGILVMNSIASKQNQKIPKWQNIFWGILLIVLSLAMLRSGGLKSLQTMTLITALPFGLIMLLLCFCLWKALQVDVKFHQSDFSYGSFAWNGSNWKNRLEQILTFSKKKDVKTFFQDVVFVAFTEFKNQLSDNNIEAVINKKETPDLSIELVITHDKFKNFVYGVSAEPQVISDSMIKENNAPDVQKGTMFVPITYFSDGRRGHDIQYMTKNEIIADILREYERFITLISDNENEIIINT